MPYFTNNFNKDATLQSITAKRVMIKDITSLEKHRISQLNT